MHGGGLSFFLPSLPFFLVDFPFFLASLPFFLACFPFFLLACLPSFLAGLTFPSDVKTFGGAPHLPLLL